MDIGLITAVFGGLGTGGAIAAWLVKREVSRVLAAVERVPGKDWFERVEEKLDNLPSASRFDAHFKMGHDHANMLLEHSLRLGKAERGLDDHEGRIRVIERPMGSGRP